MPLAPHKQVEQVRQVRQHSKATCCRRVSKPRSTVAREFERTSRGRYLRTERMESLRRPCPSAPSTSNLIASFDPSQSSLGRAAKTSAPEPGKNATSHRVEADDTCGQGATRSGGGSVEPISRVWSESNEGCRAQVERRAGCASTEAAYGYLG